MEDEFIIINKTAIQQKIEELHKLCVEGEYPLSAFNVDLEHLLSQSVPLIPEIEKAFDIGSLKTEQCYNKTNGFVSGIIHTDKQDYISNLKLDI